jgi:tetratricopeptide (TPR) repeat protein
MVLKRVIRHCILIVFFGCTACNPMRSHHRFLLGQEAYFNGDYRMALTLIDTVDLNGSDGVQACLIRGWSHYFEKEYLDAELSFRLCLESGKTNQIQTSDARNGLARCAYVQKNYDEAASEAAASLESDDAQVDVWLLLGWSHYFNENIDQADSAFLSALDLSLCNCEALSGHCWCQVRSASTKELSRSIKMMNRCNCDMGSTGKFQDILLEILDSSTEE